MIATLKLWWAEHGTKILGFGSTAIGTLSMIDATTVHLIEQTFGPHWGHRIASGLMILGGIGVAARGFTNTKAGR